MNGDRRRVILFGDSLILEGVRANLKTCPDLDVLVLDQPLHRPFEELRRLCPAAVIFDLGVIQPDFLLSLFQEPGLLLIGINIETHQALLWSGRQAAAVESSDLVSVIRADFIQKKNLNSEITRTGTQILGKEGS
jgi:hypothetical protein